LGIGIKKLVETQSGNAQPETVVEKIPEVVNLTVRVLVEGEPARFTTVYLHSTVREAVTDGDGYVTFYNVEQGDHKIVLKYNNKTYENKVSLNYPEKQIHLTIAAEEKKASFLWLWWLLVIPVVLFGYFYLAHYFSRQKYSRIR